MTILGIENRSENCKTALHFSPLFGGNGVRLIERLGESPRPRPDDVNLELFWKGMRDFLHRDSEKKEAARGQFVDLYLRLFPDLNTFWIARPAINIATGKVMAQSHSVS